MYVVGTAPATTLPDWMVGQLGAETEGRKLLLNLSTNVEYVALPKYSVISLFRGYKIP